MRDQILIGAAIIAGGMIVAGFFIGGRYVVTPYPPSPSAQSGGSVYVDIAIVDRFTGSATICNPTSCHPAQ